MHYIPSAKFVAVIALVTMVSGSVVPAGEAHAARSFGSRNYSYVPSTEGGTFTHEQISSWRSSSSALSKKIDALDSDPVEHFPIPVLFGVSLSNLSPNFGDPRSDGRTHEGLDIMAVSGTPIVSPTDAVVMKTGSGDSSGNFVYTANPGGETFAYMHLDTIADISEGDVLSPGDVIGYVGNTGNASGGAAHLHFEVRENRTPMDPLPRMTQEFSLEEKMDFLETILSSSNDEDKLATLLVTNFTSTFAKAISEGLDVPSLIEKELALVAQVKSTGVVTTTSTTGNGDLTIGASGTAVITLQQRLITASTGPAAKSLATAGATGYFGAMTASALIEYQTAAGISPATGYYGPLTRAYMESGKTVASTPATTPTATSGSTVGSSASGSVPASDLTLGAKGSDVIWLQEFLIEEASGPQAASLKAAGATGYFGAVTKAALSEYQAKNGISPATGYFGPLTRAEVSQA